MSEGWVLLLITDLIGKNSAIDLNDHFNPLVGGSYTHAEDSIIIRTPPTREYKKGRRLQWWWLEKLGEKHKR